MYLQKPNFKFCLFLVDAEKKKINQTICLADTYDIQNDGAIIFYQIAVKNEKGIKVPVLAYPKGKWEACILVDENNEYPVFGKNSNSELKPSPNNIVQQPTPAINSSNSNSNRDRDNNSPFINSNASDSDNTSSNTNSNTNNSSNSTDDFDDLDSFGDSSGNNSNNSSSSQGNNPQEFKKLKSEWLEKLMIDFTKTQDFNMIQFMKSISNNPQLKVFKPSENDITWAAAALIQNRLVLSRKFSNPGIQKQFDLILASIMKRLWDGQMAPILTTLQEKEETKDANAIDLAVWMSKNNY